MPILLSSPVLGSSSSSSYSSRRIWSKFAVALAFLSFGLWRLEQHYYPPTDSSVGIQQFGELTLRPDDYNERITLISVFGGATAAAYIPLFLQTAAQNSASLDLLFVNIDNGKGCMNMSYATDPESPTYASNIKHLCLTERENDVYYKRWICEGWGGCSQEAEHKVMSELQRLHDEVWGGDEIYNTFKPWRGLVYKEHVKTDWWAWFDADAVIGKYEHLFPKDIMNNFDLIVVAQHDTVHPGLVLTGQNVLFKNNEKMARVPFRYKALASLDGLSLLRPGDHGNSLDEGLYSDLYMNRFSEVDILRLPGMMAADPTEGDRRNIMVDGHILNVHRNLQRADIQDWFNKIHDPDARDYRVGRTLTPYGRTFEIENSYEEVFWCNGVSWNPANNCPEFHASDTMRVLLYRKGGGKWRYRREVKLYPTHHSELNSVQPELYIHFLFWKKRVKDFHLPDWTESGYLAERQNDGSSQRPDMLLKKGSEATVVEFSVDWVAAWTMTVGAAVPPRGFIWSHKLNDPFINTWEKYYPYHTFNDEYEVHHPKAAPEGHHRWTHENMDIEGEDPRKHLE